MCTKQNTPLGNRRCRSDAWWPVLEGSFRRFGYNPVMSKLKSSKRKTKSQGNDIDAFAKRMLGRIFVFVDFLLHYANQQFVAEIDLKRIKPAPYFIWGIADDVLRDVYVRGKYRDVILLMTVIHRLDVLLEPTKKAVLDMNRQLDRAKIVLQS